MVGFESEASGASRRPKRRVGIPHPSEFSEVSEGREGGGVFEAGVGAGWIV